MSALGEFQPPDPDEDREAMAEAHWEKQLAHAYAEGRKDEREFTVKTLENELTFARSMAKENGGNPRYDYYADCLEMLINDFKEAA